MSFLEVFTKENKEKRIRNKNSYIDAFLDRRKQAANFALSKKSQNKAIKEISEKAKKDLIKTLKDKKSLNSYETKEKFFNTYNSLKSKLIGKSKSINNLMYIERETTKHFWSTHYPRGNSESKNFCYNKHYCENCKNNTFKKDNTKYYVKYKHRVNNRVNNYMTEKDETNKKYNNVRHHSINLSSKNKKNEKKKKQIGFGNSLKIQKVSVDDFIINDDKDNIIIIKEDSKPYEENKKNKRCFTPNEKYEPVMNEYQNKNIEKDFKQNNDINEAYYEGVDNHAFYDSNKIKKEKNKEKPFKEKKEKPKIISRNLSEPKDLDSKKYLYNFNNMKKGNKIDQIYQISPIKTFFRYDCDFNNDDIQNIDKKYDNSLNKNNTKEKSKQNLKLQNENKKINKENHSKHKESLTIIETKNIKEPKNMKQREDIIQNNKEEEIMKNKYDNEESNNEKMKQNEDDILIMSKKEDNENKKDNIDIKEDDNICNNEKTEENLNSENQINNNNNQEETKEEKNDYFMEGKDDEFSNNINRKSNSLFSSKEDSEKKNNRLIIIKEIKSKIEILKKNKKSHNKKIQDYNLDIDKYFMKIKKKEEKNNQTFKELYQEILEKDAKNFDERQKSRNNDKKDTNKGADGKKNEKKKIIQKSNRLQNMMKDIFIYSKYKFGIKNDMEIDSKEFTFKNNFKAPDINLIVDENKEANMKIIDEEDYLKLMKNKKNRRKKNFMNKLSKEKLIKETIDIPKLNFYKNGNFKFGDIIKNNDLSQKRNSYTQRSKIYELDEKIMPPNEI